jgi:thiamine-monophosphate kinase
MVGKWLNQNGIARSMIDISDGLSSDIRHLCEASGVGATIYADGLPIDPKLYGDFDADRRLKYALSGGEDFELLFTTGEEQLSLPDGYPVAKIGEINSEKGTIRLIRNGNVEELPPGGFQHF